MRVYFNGSFCNGKTSLKNWVSKAYGLKMIPEIARTVLAEREITTKEQLAKLRSDTELLYIIQREIIERQYKEESLLGRDFSACRGIDSVAFLIEFCQPKHVLDFTVSPLFRDYVTWLRKDDVVTFLVKPEKSLLSQDALRDSDWDLSLKIYGCVSTLLRTNGISYHLISDPNMSERQNNISNIISSLGAKKEVEEVLCAFHGKVLKDGDFYVVDKNCKVCKTKDQ